MLTHQPLQPLFRCRSLVGCGFLVTLVVGMTQSPLAASPCVSAIDLAAGESWRDPGQGLGDQVCFSLVLETPGILTVDLATAATAPQARLLWLSTGEPDLLWQSPTGLIVGASAGRFELRVAAENPRLALAPFRLATRFLPFTSKAGKDSEIEIEPMGKVTVCRPEAGDDHADDLGCATPLVLGELATGELANGWGDDVDAFGFRLGTLDAIELRARGEPGLALALYDRHGLRLATAFDRGRGLSMVRALVPGDYFVRLEGRGLFELSVEAVSELPK